jgi:hypothetical protein
MVSKLYYNCGCFAYIVLTIQHCDRVNHDTGSQPITWSGAMSSIEARPNRKSWPRLSRDVALGEKFMTSFSVRGWTRVREAVGGHGEP